MRHILNTTILLLLCPLFAFSQYYLKGQIRDERGNALQNANICVQSTGYVYFSGGEGGFGIITYNKKDTLSIWLDGFTKMKVPVDATNFVDVVLKKAPISKSSLNKLSSLTQNLKRESQQQWFTGDETYASIIENQFIDAGTYPSTGLTLNVDRASYSNIRRFLSLNTVVPPDAVRIEEMLNYFNFNYKEPPDHKCFAIKTVLTRCPWNENNRLLFAQVSSRKLSLDSLPASHLVFLIDVSGSMDMPNRLPLLKSGFKALVNNLRDKDSVSIVVYGGTVGIALPTTGGGEKQKIFRAIDSLQPGGSTPGESGIKLAYSVARNHFIKNGNNRIILATDGDFNVGLKTEDELEEMIARQKEAGIYLTCLGIGMGNYKDSKIETLAHWGNGNFAYLDSYNEAEKVLLKEFAQMLFTVADDAYLNVRFDPELVSEYRLLGFDNKVGAIKDTTATVEGGEVGSAYSSMIAFELVPTARFIDTSEGIKWKPVQFDLQYKMPESSKLQRLTEQPEVTYTPFRKTENCYQFASSVIMFGSLLRKSRYVKDITWNTVYQTAAGAADTSNYSQKEFLLLVQQAKLVYSRKRKKTSD